MKEGYLAFLGARTEEVIRSYYVDKTIFSCKALDHEWGIMESKESFGTTKKAMIASGRQKILVEVEGCKFFKNQAILKFKGIDTINDVEKYKGAGLWVTRENAVPLEEGEFYIADIIDAKVYEEDGTCLGTLTDVMETGANDVYVVRMEDGKELLIPAIPQCILDVDVEEPRVTVRLMKGMLE